MARWALLIVAVIVIPLLPSLIVWYVGLSDSLQLLHGACLRGLIVVSYIGLGILAVRQRAMWRHRYTDTGGSFMPHRVSCLLIVLLAAVLIVIVLLSLHLPLYANDPVQYATIARIARGTGGFSFYPMQQAEAGSGFIVYMLHPPGYASNILAHWLIGVGGDEFGFAKTITPWFAIATLCLFMFSIPRLGMDVRVMGALAFVLTPLYAYQVITHGVDPIIMACALALALVLSRGMWKSSGLVLAVVLLGLLVFSHSLGLVVGALLMMGYLTAGREPLGCRLVNSLLVGLGGLLLGGYQYLDNYVVHGSMLRDQTPIWQIAEIARAEFLDTRDGMAGWADKFLHGILMPFTRLTFYGVIPWLALALFPFWGRHWKQEPLVRISAIFIALYWLLIIALVIKGNDAPIRGSRYFLPMLPFFTILSMFGLQQLVVSRCGRGERQGSRGQPVKVAVLLGLLQVSPVALASVAVLNTPLHNLVYGDRAWFETKALDSSSLAYLLEKAAKISRQPGNLLLTFRMDQLAYYTDARFVRYLDGRLEPFYHARSPDDAFDELIRLGISHVFLPNYSLAEIENSWIRRIVGDPLYSEVVARNSHGVLYHLYGKKRPPPSGGYDGYCRWWSVDDAAGNVDGENTPCIRLRKLSSGTYRVRLPIWGEGVVALRWEWQGRARARVQIRRVEAETPFADVAVVLSRGNKGFAELLPVASGARELELKLHLDADGLVWVSPLAVILRPLHSGE